MQERKIGHEYALFYEAYGTYYELRGNTSAADAVFNEGISRWDNIHTSLFQLLHS
jgi:hypothetical protein